MKKALITGVGGQDGSYLAELLLKLGYEVHGIARGLIYESMYQVKGVTIHIGDMRDTLTLETIFRKVWPDEIYNLAGQVFVPASWTRLEDTFDVNVSGLGRLLKLIDELKPDTKIYQASSSEMYGNIGGAIHEDCPMRPVSPYGVSKLAAHNLIQVYRDKGLFAVSGILFNHESPRRQPHMVTRKITMHIARWVCGDSDVLELGNLQAARDWGHSKDYVRAMHFMLQNSIPEDFVIGTGEAHTVEEFLLESVAAAGLRWIDCRDLVQSNAKNFTRKNELFYLRADGSKATSQLGWKPDISFKQLVREMVSEDIRRETWRRKEDVETVERIMA